MTERKMGALRSEVDIRDYKFKQAKFMAAVYPETYECPNKMRVRDQGSVGSCVAYSSSSILEYHYGETMSTNFIYGIHKKLFNSDGPGMFPREACKIIRSYGDPTYKSCPGNDEVPEAYKIAETAYYSPLVMNEASRYRISSYARVSSINDIKYALMHYGPVLGAVIWFSDNKLSPTNVLLKGTFMDGGHAIVIKGWNSEGWVCQNSWGTGYGDKGTFILPYSYGLFEAYSLIPGTPDEDDIVKPSICNWLSKIVNAVINFFRKVFHI